MVEPGDLRCRESGRKRGIKGKVINGKFRLAIMGDDGVWRSTRSGTYWAVTKSRWEFRCHDNEARGVLAQLYVLDSRNIEYESQVVHLLFLNARKVCCYCSGVFFSSILQAIEGIKLSL